VQTLCTIQTQPKCSIIRAYGLNLVKTCSGICCVHIGRNIRGMTKGWLPKCGAYIGECAKGTCPLTVPPFL
jgi:hypothetical protein